MMHGQKNIKIVQWNYRCALGAWTIYPEIFICVKNFFFDVFGVNVFTNKNIAFIVYYVISCVYDLKIV
jgi:hypothetical protein